MESAPDLIWDYNGDQDSPIYLNKRDTSYIITRRQVGYLLHNIQEIQMILKKEIRHVQDQNNSNDIDRTVIHFSHKNQFIQRFLAHSYLIFYVIIVTQILAVVIDTVLIYNQIYKLPIISLVTVCAEVILFGFSIVDLYNKINKDIAMINCWNMMQSIISFVLIFATINSIINRFNFNSWKYAFEEDFNSNNLYLIIYLRMTYNCIATFTLHSSGMMLPVSIFAYISTTILMMISYFYLLISLCIATIRLCFNTNKSQSNASFTQPGHLQPSNISAPINSTTLDPTGYITPLGQSYIGTYDDFCNAENLIVVEGSSNEHKNDFQNSNDEEPLLGYFD